LPRERVEIDVPDTDKQCACGRSKTRIGETVSETLDYVPARLRVVETARPKYARPHGHDGVIQASAPPQAAERSLATEGLLAHVVVSKYVDHLPLYRLEGIFDREHLDLSRATLCGWVADAATALTPIGEELRRQVVAATYLQTDDTPITILEETGSRKGRIWTYLDPLARQVVFDATPTHEREGPATCSPRRRVFRSWSGSPPNATPSTLARQIEVLAIEDPFQAIERQIMDMLRDDHVREQPFVR